MIAPMRAELTGNGFTEFRTAEDVENHLTDHKGTTMIVINSVCGCAAGSARPGAVMALKNTDKKPDTLATVFAGNDVEAAVRHFGYAGDLFSADLYEFPRSSHGSGLQKREI